MHAELRRRVKAGMRAVLKEKGDPTSRVPLILHSRFSRDVKVRESQQNDYKRPRDNLFNLVFLNSLAETSEQQKAAADQRQGSRLRSGLESRYRDRTAVQEFSITERV